MNPPSKPKPLSYSEWKVSREEELSTSFYMSNSTVSFESFLEDLYQEYLIQFAADAFWQDGDIWDKEVGC